MVLPKTKKKKAERKLEEKTQQRAGGARPRPRGAAAATSVKPVSAPASKPQPPGSPKAPAAKAVDETLWIHDDLDLDSLDLDEELAKLEEQEQQLSQQFLALERAPRYSESFGSATAQDDDDVHDEAWAEALLRDEQVKRDSFELEPTNAPEPAPRQSDEPLAAASPAASAVEREQPQEPRIGALDAADAEDDQPHDEPEPDEPEPESINTLNEAHHGVAAKMDLVRVHCRPRDHDRKRAEPPIW